MFSSFSLAATRAMFYLPNPVAGLIIGSALLLSAVVGTFSADAAQLFDEFAKNRKQNYQQRNKMLSNQILDYVNADKDALKNRVETQQKTRPVEQKLKEHIVDSELERKKAQGDTTTQRARQHAEGKVVKADVTRSVRVVKTQAAHREKEHEVEHRTFMLNETKAHLDRMTTATQSLSTAAQEATGAAKTNASVTQEATREVLAFGRAYEEVMKAYKDLSVAFANQDETQEKAQAVQEAMLLAIHAEGQLDKEIRKQEIKGDSEARMAFTSDMAIKNTHLKSLIATSSHETLQKIADLTEKEIVKQQSIVDTLDGKPGDIDKANQRLAELHQIMTEVKPMIEIKRKEGPVVAQGHHL
ncbi:MAG: hypothetical protein ACOYKA_04505 [Legionellaceae bacterium]